MAGTDWLSNLAGVKQGTGVVGKLCTVAMMAFGVIGVAMYSMREGWNGLPWIAGTVIIAILFVWFVERTLKYAEKNPNEATMDGRDLLKYRIKTLEMAEKGQAPAMPTANTPPPAEIANAQDDQ